MYKTELHDSYSKQLAKISSTKFGRGGYQDVQFGLTLSFSGAGFSSGAFIPGGWDWSMTADPDEAEHCQWSEADRSEGMAKMCRTISQILQEAKCATIDQLQNKPVEIGFEAGCIKSWRILSEVL